jgi:hypothetical protein
VSGSLGAVGGHFTRTFTGSAAALTTSTVGGVSGLAGGATDRLISGDQTNGFDVLFDTTSGAAVAHMPSAGTISGTTAPGRDGHLGSAYAGQHGSWISDTVKFVGEKTGAFPSND